MAQPQQGGGVDESPLIKSPLVNVRYEFSCEDGPDAQFRVYRMRLTEELNGSFEIDLDLVTDQLNADTDLLLGVACQLDISRGDHVRSVYALRDQARKCGLDYDATVIDELLRARSLPAFS